MSPHQLRRTPLSHAARCFCACHRGGGPSRKADGGATTNDFRAAAQAAKPKPTKKTKKSVEPDKWIDGRSGPMINPAWTRWSKSQ